MNVSKPRLVMRTIGGILFSILLLLLMVNFESASKYFFSKLTFITETAVNCIVHIVRYLPYELQVIAFIIIKVLAILFGVVIVIAAIFGASIYHGNIGGPGVDMAIRELFRKKKKDNLQNKE